MKQVVFDAAQADQAVFAALTALGVALQNQRNAYCDLRDAGISREHTTGAAAAVVRIDLQLRTLRALF